MKPLIPTVLTLILSCPAVAAHGGQAPVPSNGGFSTIKIVSGGTSLGPTSTPGPRARKHLPTGPAVHRVGPAAGSGRDSGRRGASSGTPVAPEPLALDGWEAWWIANRDAYLPLRERRVARGVSSGTIGLLTGKGHRIGAPDRGLVDRGRVLREVLPVLTGLLDRHEADLVDSAVLALGRVGDEGSRDGLSVTLRMLLARPERSVATSAALALGLVGGSDAERWLIDLVTDGSRGRQLVGGGAVPAPVRQFGALGLGLMASENGTLSLLSLLERLGPSDEELRVCAALGLSQLPGDHPLAGQVVVALRRLITSRRCPPRLAAHATTALAKVGHRGSVRTLQDLLVDRDTDAVVRQAAALGLGVAAQLDDPGLLDVLLSVLEKERDATTRHLSLIALGRIAGRDHAALDRSAQHDRVERAFTRELQGDGKQRSHRPWAAFGVAMYGRQVDDPARRDRLVGQLAAAFDDAGDPSVRGAVALSLGMLHARFAGPLLLRALQRTDDVALQGQLAVALGLLEQRDAADELLRLCTRRTTAPALRRDAAVGLGLLGEGAAVTALLDVLGSASTPDECAGAASALALLGDASALEPLLVVAMDTRAPAIQRGFAVAAIGLLAEHGPRRFHSALLADVNTAARTPALSELMDIL